MISFIKKLIDYLIVFRDKMNYWPTLPPHIVCNIFIHLDARDIFTFFLTSKNSYIWICRYIIGLYSPVSIKVSTYLLRGLRHLKRMSNVSVILTQVEDANIIRSMYQLEEANFLIDLTSLLSNPSVDQGPSYRVGEYDSLRILDLLMDNYYAPVIINEHSVKRVKRDLWSQTSNLRNSAIFRIVFMDNEKLGDMIIISREVIITTFEVDSKLVKRLCQRFDITKVFSIPNDPGPLDNSKYIQLSTHPFFIRRNIHRFLSQVDLGPVVPTRPSGPDNPNIKNLLTLFKTRISFPLVLGYLIKIAFARSSSVKDKLKYWISDISSLTIGNLVTNSLIMKGNYDVGDLTTIFYPPENKNYTHDFNIVYDVFHRYLEISKHRVVIQLAGSHLGVPYIPIDNNVIGLIK